MKLLNISAAAAAAAVVGAGVAFGAGVLVTAAPAQADLPPGTYWCWSHLVPNGQQCPSVPPWGTRWQPCNGWTDPLLFVLDDNQGTCPAAPANPPASPYTFNCWGHDMILGQICPPVPPGPDSWLPCPNLPGHVYTLDGSCKP